MAYKFNVFIPTATRKFFHLKLASSCVSQGCNGLFDLVQAINTIRGAVGEEPLKDRFKDKYDEKCRRFKLYCMMVSRVESYLVGISTRQISMDDVSSDRFKEYQKALYTIPIVESTAFEFLQVLIEATQIRNVPIETKAFAQVKRENKRIDRSIYGDDEESNEQGIGNNFRSGMEVAKEESEDD